MTEQMTPEKADYMSRCFVNGLRRHGKSGKMEPASGEFSQRFLSHPWVRESVTEGWDKELRGHLIRTVKIRLMRDESYQAIEDLMPPRKWVDDAKHHAARYRSAADWQKKNLHKGYGLQSMLSGLARRSGIDPATGEIIE